MDLDTLSRPMYELLGLYLGVFLRYVMSQVAALSGSTPSQEIFCLKPLDWSNQPLILHGAS